MAALDLKDEMTAGFVSSARAVIRAHQERVLFERGRLFLWGMIVVVLGLWGLHASGLVTHEASSLPFLNAGELCILAAALTQSRRPWYRRHALGLSVAFCVQLVAFVALYGLWTGELWMLALRLTALNLVMAAVFPWGVAAQGVVVAASSLGFASVHWNANGTLNHPSTIPTLVLFAVSLLIAFWANQAHARIATEIERRQTAEGALRHATEGANVAVWDADIRTGKVRLVSGWDRLLGRYEDEITLVELLDLVHVDDRARTTVSLQEHLQGRKSTHDIEHRIRHADGSYRWVLGRRVVTCDALGRPHRMQGVVIDISDRKRLEEALQDIEARKHVEEALRESEARYRGHFEQAAIGIAFVGVDGRYLRVNQRLCDIVGYTEPELCARTFKDITHPDDLDRDLGAMRDMLDGKIQTHSIEKRYLRKDGSMVWVDLTVSLVREPSGRPKYFVSVVEDIEARKRTESERERLLLFLDSIVENIPDMVFVKDAKSLRYVLFNRAGTEPFGYARADLIGKNDYDLFPKEVADFLTEKDRAVLHDKTLLDIPEERISTAHRGERILHTKKIPILDDKGEPAYLLGISEDITDRKHADQRLALLSRRLMEVQESERRHLARELHDEIGQYLTGISLLLGELARQPPDSASATLGEAHKLVDDLIVRVRDLSLDLRPAMLDDLGLLPALLWLFGRFSRQTNIEVDFHHSGLDRRFPQDVETAAYRIVQEALTNVARHAGVSKARVRGSTNDHVLSVVIADEGRGFDADAVLAAGGTSGFSGMRERAVLAGGSLSVESGAGTGTRVRAEFKFNGSGVLKPG
jgi:PAS domain S-box-containing protein